MKRQHIFCNSTNGSKKQILFYGYYGQQNTGDDAFVEVATWGARKFWDNDNVKFLTQNLPEIISNADYLGKSYSKFHKQLKITSAIFKSDVFICAGGSTFHSRLNSLNPKNIAKLKKKAISQNFLLGAIGVSLGPYKSLMAEKSNIELLKQFDFLTLRDQYSYNLALSYNLPYNPIEAFDLAALLPDVYNEKILFDRSNNKILGISVCYYERYVFNGNIQNEERRNRNIEELLIKISKESDNVTFRFFVFNGNSKFGDWELTKIISDKLRMYIDAKIEIFPYNPNTYQTWSRVQECNVFISTRLHAAIFACFANVPFFLIEYHRKCSDFLNDIGYYQKYRIFDADFKIEVLSDFVNSILIDKNSYIKPTEIIEVIEKSRRNFENVII